MYHLIFRPRPRKASDRILLTISPPMEQLLLRYNNWRIEKGPSMIGDLIAKEPSLVRYRILLFMLCYVFPTLYHNSNRL